MKIFMTGGRGFLGSVLLPVLRAAGHEVTILTRMTTSPAGTDPGVTWITGDPVSPGAWQDRLLDHDVVINLAGASIFTRWSSRARRRIYESRILTTRNVAGVLNSPARRVSLLLNASAVGYYGFHASDTIDELRPQGRGFLAEVTAGWEKEALRAAEAGVRVVLCRFGVVLGKGGGAFPRMLAVFRRGAGSRLGRGDQWVSWIHTLDLAGALVHLMKIPDMNGAVNLTSPYPVTNAELTRCLNRSLHKRVLLPAVPGFMLRMAWGPFADTLLKGQRVVPERLLRSGFKFCFPTLAEAFTDLVGPT